MDQIKNLLSTETLTLGDYLELKAPYRIPFSQRNYEWGNAEVNRLWNDVVALCDNLKSLHMLNVVTLSNNDADNEESLSIYDGQQRTITSLLIIAVLAQRLGRIDADAGKELQSNYLKKISALDKQNVQYKLAFDNREDSKLFYELTDYLYRPGTQLNANVNSGNAKALIANYDLINQNMDQFLKDCMDDNEVHTKLLLLWKQMVKHCYLIKLVSANEDIAIRMFESLNNTGKSLERYYVLKNDLVKILGEDQVRPEWQKIDGDLNDYSPDKFLLMLANVINGKTSASKILPAIYSQFDAQNTIEMQDLLDLLVIASNDYLKLMNPSQLVINNQNNRDDVLQFRQYSKDLASFGFKQHMPILLSMLIRKHPLADINRMLWNVIALYVRNYGINDEKSNILTAPFAMYANQIYNGKLDIDTLCENIESFAKNDTSVLPNLLIKQFNSNRVAKTMLKILYNENLVHGETKLDIDKIDLEHILPQTPKSNSHWVQIFSDDQRDELTNQLGNLTLWFDKANRGLKNAEFHIKKSEYAKSPLQENQQLSRMDDWNADSIQNRTKSLADSILKTFVFK